MDLMSTADTALFGRETYQEFERYGPGVPGNSASTKNDLEFSRWIDETPKMVASRTVNRLAWKNSALLSGNVTESVLAMKGQTGNNVLVFGSPGLAACLMGVHLIDELRIMVHPVLLGAGRPLLQDVSERHKLKLVKARTLASGVVGLSYETA